MWLDAVALFVLGIFIGMGALRGALATGMSLLTLVVAYTTAIVAAPRLGPGLALGFGLPKLVGLPLAGTLAFAAAFIVMTLVSRVLRRRERRLSDGTRGVRDRFLGGVFGATRGAMIVLLISWLALWVDVLRTTGTVEGLPELGDSTAAALTVNVVEAGVEAALADAGPSGRLIARVAARPGAAIADIQELVEDPRITALREDKLFWTYLESEAVDAALNRGSFVAITYDGSLRQRLADLGLIEPEAAADPGVFRAAAEDVLHEVAPRLRGLRDDPEVQRLMEDPEVVAMVQSGDTMALMGHPGFRQLVSRIASQAR